MNPKLLLRLRDRRRGVALIVVLAMATLLTAVAVSLVSAARVDRLAGNNYLDSVVARRLVNLGLDGALRTARPSFAAVTPAATPPLRVIPNQNILVVNGAGGVISAPDAASLTDQYTLSYFNTNNVSTIRALVPSARWTELTNTAGRVVGRFVAVVEDHSGLADLNAVTGAAFLQRDAAGKWFTNLVARAPYRVSPAQMDASPLLARESLPVQTESQVFDKLVNNSASLLGRFESVPDIRTYATSSTMAKTAERFTYYSRAPLLAPTYRDGLITTNRWVNISRVDTGSPTIALPTTTTNLIRTAFQDILPDGVPQNRHTFGARTVTSSEIAADALLDYVDTDNVPRNPYFSSERIFMFNEIVFGAENVSSSQAGNSGNYLNQLDVNLKAELFYPYVTSNAAPNITNEARLTVEYTIEESNGAQVDPSASHTLTIAPVTFTSGASGRFPTLSLQNPKRHTFVTAGPPGNVTIKGRIVLATVTEGNTVVDSILPADMAPVTFSFGDQKALMHLEALDPRGNHDLNGSFTTVSGVTKAWAQNPRKDDLKLTLGAVNDYTKAVLGTGGALVGYFDAPANPRVEDLETFVANSQINIAGELGYLPVNAWKSFKLYGSTGQAAHPVLDFFYSTNCYTRLPANRIVPGLVNPNTSERDVLGMVFAGATLDRYAGENGALVIDSASAINTFAAPLIKAAGKYPYLNPSDAYDVPAFGTALLALPNLNELQREAAVRNSYSLLTTRNNTLQVLLLVQAVKLDGGTRVPVATEKVLATVWRDPVSRIVVGGDREYRYFTRTLTYLND